MMLASSILGMVAWLLLGSCGFAVLLLPMWVIMVYNQLRTQQVRAQNAFSQIDVHSSVVVISFQILASAATVHPFGGRAPNNCRIADATPAKATTP